MVKVNLDTNSITIILSDKKTKTTGVIVEEPLIRFDYDGEGKVIGIEVIY